MNSPEFPPEFQKFSGIPASNPAHNNFQALYSVLPRPARRFAAARRFAGGQKRIQQCVRNELPYEVLRSGAVNSNTKTKRKFTSDVNCS